MHNVRITVAAAVAVALAGVSYLASRQSTAQSYGELSAPSRIDAFAFMVAAKGLPSEQYDTHWLSGGMPTPLDHIRDFRSGFRR